MKNLLTVIILVVSFRLNAQENFTLTKDGFTDFVVVNIEGKSSQELYNKTLQWLEITYKNPKEVLKGKIDNDYIRFEGATNSLICMNLLGKSFVDSKYQIEISFKDDKYKFDVIDISTYNSPTQYSSGGWSSFDLNNMSIFYNKKGQIRSTYKYYPDIIPSFFNNLNNRLKDFILSEQIPSKKSEW